MHDEFVDILDSSLTTLAVQIETMRKTMRFVFLKKKKRFFFCFFYCVFFRVFSINLLLLLIFSKQYDFNTTQKSNDDTNTATTSK